MDLTLDRALSAIAFCPSIHISHAPLRDHSRRTNTGGASSSWKRLPRTRADYTPTQTIDNSRLRVPSMADLALCFFSAVAFLTVRPFLLYRSTEPS
jgi:hypothetical protein